MKIPWKDIANLFGEQFQAWIELFSGTQIPLKDIGSLLVVVAFVAEMIRRLVLFVWKRYDQYRLNKDLEPYYSKQAINDYTQYYVETQCQNIPPSKEHEMRHGFALVTKEKAISFFLKKAFKSDDRKFYIVLGDSGMGKTTFMVNLYLRYINQWRKKYNIVLIPLWSPKVCDKIDKIKDQKNTILLLDAFDEDPDAVDDYKQRIDTIAQKGKEFREVVITCRTQFFPTEKDEPYELEIRTAEGFHTFYKMYLSPFDDNDIKKYLNKKYGILKFWNHAKKRKAKKIVHDAPHLMVRPMLLSYIDDLLTAKSSYEYLYEIYEVLIEKWINREAEKRIPSEEERPKFKQDLYDFSQQIAIDIYLNREERDGLFINHQDVEPFVQKCGLENIDDITARSRSLLNRNASGQYKFSHKSILEYFLAKEAFNNADFHAQFSFEGMSASEIFFREFLSDRLDGIDGKFIMSDNINKTYKLVDLKTEDLNQNLIFLVSNPEQQHELDSLVFPFHSVPKQFSQSLYEIYKFLIEKWINREAEKRIPSEEERPKFKQDLYDFSQQIAIDIYLNREERDGLFINHQDVEPFVQKCGLENIDDITARSRSLLNRNAAGQYKFSHKSILEYFLAKEAFNNADFHAQFSFEGMSAAKQFYDEFCLKWLKKIDGSYTVENRTTALNNLKFDELDKNIILWIDDPENHSRLNFLTFPFHLNSIHGIEFVYVPAGTFEMGDLWGDGDDDEKPVHTVELDGFYMGKYQVTNAQYAQFLNEYGGDTVKEGEYKGKTMIYEYNWGLNRVNGQWQPANGYANHPVVRVTWYGAYEFCRYYGFQLPTEAQWEYAARSGGKKEKWSGTSDENELTNYAWYDDNSDGHPHEVGTRLPNGLGLYDMSGNVWEWCQDWYDGAYYQKLSNKVSKNPVNTNESSFRVLRGGSWYDAPRYCRVAPRLGYNPGRRAYDSGFRVVCFVAVSKTP